MSVQLHLKMKERFWTDNSSYGLGEREGGFGLTVILYSITTSSSSSNDDDSGSSYSCEVRGKDKEQEDTQQGSHFGSSEKTRFEIWNVKSDFTMDGQNVDGRN